MRMSRTFTHGWCGALCLMFMLSSLNIYLKYVPYNQTFILKVMPDLFIRGRNPFNQLHPTQGEASCAGMR